MKCNWCGEGKGRNYTTDKEGKIYYYYCQKCVGDFKQNPFEQKDREAGIKEQEENSGNG